MKSKTQERSVNIADYDLKRILIRATEDEWTSITKAFESHGLKYADGVRQAVSLWLKKHRKGSVLKEAA